MERCRSGLSGTLGKRVYVKTYREFESLSFRNMFYVYVLWSDKLQKRYIGFTGDITKRLTEHNSSKSPFTKSGLPWKLIRVEEYSSKTEAQKRENFLKSGVVRKYLDSELKKKDL